MLHQPEFAIEVHRSDGRVVLALSGELDLHTVVQVRAILEEIHKSDVKQIVLDVRRLTFMDSTGVHLLIEEQAAATGSDHSFVVAYGEGPVQRVLAMSGLEDHFEPVPALATADQGRRRARGVTESWLRAL